MTPPEKDEIEISIFGPGYGESILIHLGKNDWVIVDSCIDPLSKDPAPLTYLKKIGILPASCIRQIIATHWHDDHIRGLHQIVNECQSAEFVFSKALKTKEFLTLAVAYGKRAMMETSGVQEFYKILKTLEDRKGSNHKPVQSYKFAIADRCLLKIEKEGSSCSVHSLSPSDESIRKSLIDIFSLIPTAGESKRHISIKNPNYCAVALWIQINELCVLLGSDLEENGGTSSWSAILSSTGRPQGKASIFKIPHHGSSTANHPSVWSELLETQPYALLTPFVKGSIRLPQKKDSQRINSYTDNAYITAKLEQKKSNISRPRAVERSIKEVVGSLKFAHSSTGQVRLRGKPLNGSYDWKVDLFGDAMTLKELYAV